MALKAGYRGIKHVGPGLNLNRNGDLTIKGAVPTTLEQLSDVEIDTALGGDVLRFDSTGNVWEAEQPSTTPEEDSDDLITSGGVYAALQQIQPVNADWNATEGLAEILNKPTIPAAQVNSDWNATEGLAEILNKPTIPAAQVNSDWNASSGIAEILNKPTIPDISGKADITAIGTNETGNTASKAYAAGEHFYKNGKFCTAITAIASGEIFTLGTNYVEGTIADVITDDLLFDRTDLNVADSTFYSISTITSNLDYKALRILVLTTDNDPQWISLNLNVVKGGNSKAYEQVGVALTGNSLYQLSLLALLSTTELRIRYDLVGYSNKHITGIKVYGVK